YEKLKKEGICPNCLDRAQPGKVWCAVCTELASLRKKGNYKQLRAERIEKGRCADCTKPNDNLPERVCFHCKQLRAATKARWLSKPENQAKLAAWTEERYKDKEYMARN